MEEYAFGVDASLTGFAICAYPRPAPGVPFDINGFVTKRFTSKPASDVYGRVARYKGLRNQAMLTISAIGAPAKVFLEGYSYGSTGQAMIDIAEFGGLLRLALAGWAPTQLREVSPNTLKQFATDKGNSKKEYVMACVAHRYGLIHPSNDECDAWVLSYMACCALGWATAATALQRTAVDVANNGKPKAPKKAKV